MVNGQALREDTRLLYKFRGQLSEKNRVVAAIMNQGKMPMVKICVLIKWKDRMNRKPISRVRLKRRAGTMSRSRSRPEYDMNRIIQCSGQMDRQTTYPPNRPLQTSVVVLQHGHGSWWRIGPI